VSPKNSTNLLARYSNEDLWRTTGQEKMELQIKRKRWGPGVGGSAQTKYQHHQAGLEMEPQGKRKRGRPRNSWRRSIGGGVEKGRLQLAIVGETVTRQRAIERLP